MNIRRLNSVFADRTRCLDSKRECSQTELGVWTPNVSVRRPNTRTVYLIIAINRISRIMKYGDQLEDRVRVH